MSRRRIVVGLVALGMLAAGCTSPAVQTSPGTGADDAGAAPTGEPIAIGFVGELSGNFAAWGVPARDGMRLAVEDLNAAGGVDGRPVELIERDTQGVPDEGVTAFEGLVDRHGVVAVGGMISSDVALSVSRLAEQDQVPLLLVKAGSEQVLGPDTRYTFRTCLPAAPMNMQPVAEYVAAEGVTRVGAIVADYGWGRAIEGALRERFAPLEVELQIEVAPVPETDFVTYLRRLAPLDPEVIVATGHPPGALAITRQAAEMGSEALVIGPYAASASVAEGVGDAALDRYVDLACADFSSEDYQRLAARYHARFGAFMENDAVAGYAQVMMVAEAVREGGSDEPAAIAAYLHDNGFELPGYAFPLRWTAWGELAAAQPLLTVLRRVEPPAGVNPGADWYPEVLLRSEVLEPYEPPAR